MALTDSVLNLAYSLLDNGLIPDFLLRPIARFLSRQRLRQIDKRSFEANHAAKIEFIHHLRTRADIAICTKEANQQHYQIPTKFILSCLGPHAKYSACLYPTGKETLAQAELLMLESYCHKAKLGGGLDVLDLGCGWGSLALYLAQKYPTSRITALSNSSSQKTYIENKATERGLTNLEVITADVNTFDFEGKKYFDRILSIEMFEHMKNYEALLCKISSWLRPHPPPNPNPNSPNTPNSTPDSPKAMFVHRDKPYHFEEDGGWMGRTFFSGGTMPSHDLLLYFQKDLTHLQSWYLNGKHYTRTLEDWLARQDMNAREGMGELVRAYAQGEQGGGEGRKVFYRFRVFYIACSEFFGLNGGEEWGIGHYLFKAKDHRSSSSR
ncbi:hypothetical protein PILCRDRAFT_7253 [Piloderma croceum F 1598]|uniref:Methyltransferase domain-containing protein n=1 Tax=Piloderma croceum (strain F 1598) TaxID=765440 RepID=A0A0C3FYJ3_PILCF|nr:hypothetical protein PILCRDRAFT_7253 [Piloderma croceum F 1598]